MCTMLYSSVFVLLTFLSDWSWSVHPDTGFKILSPFPLIHEVRSVPTDMDVIEFHQYHAGSLTTGPDSLAFVIDHYTLPTAGPEEDPEYLNAFFENTLDELLISVEGTLVYMDIIHQPGRDVCIWKGIYGEGKGVIRGNILLYEDQSYFGLQVFGLERRKPDEKMSKFLDSFKRIPKTAP